MQKLRENKIFRIVALLLVVFFAAFAFHLIAHLGHGEEELRECSVCQAVQGFLLFVLLVFTFAVTRQNVWTLTRTAFPRYKRFFGFSLQNRAPPVSS